MIRTMEAVVDERGMVRTLDDLSLPSPRRALVTVLDEAPASDIESTLISEDALSDWNRTEEELAWSHLQPAQ